MSKLLLSCDDTVFVSGSRYYAKSKAHYDFYQRYLRIFDELVLVCRCREEESIKESRIPLDQDSRISYVRIPDFRGPIQYAKSYFAIGRILRSAVCDYDAAVLRIPSTIALRVGKSVMARRKPYAVEVVFDAQDCWKGLKGISRLLWQIIDRNMRQLCSRADGVSCVTAHYMQKHYFSLKPTSFVSHYSSLSLNKSFYGSERQFPTHRPIIIAHVSNQVSFGGRKGHNQIIESLKLLKAKGYNVVVHFVGEDYNGGINRLRNFAIEMGVADMVQFEGYLNREELDRFLSASDMFVMPTKAEGLPRVIIEAMAKGLPCITTPVSGNSELINSRYLVDYYDIVTLSNRIIELIDNRERYEQESRDNFTRSLEYEESILEKRRDGFYSALKSIVSPNQS